MKSRHLIITHTVINTTSLVVMLVCFHASKIGVGSLSDVADVSLSPQLCSGQMCPWKVIMRKRASINVENSKTEELKFPGFLIPDKLTPAQDKDPRVCVCVFLQTKSCRCCRASLT